MAGRDEDFKDKIRAAASALPGGAVDLGAIAQGPPDPRQFPFTYHEVTFRQCWEEWTVIRNEEGKVLFYRLSIVDPADRHVYHYGFNREVLDRWINDLTQMRDAGEIAEEVQLLKEPEGPLQ